MITYNPKAWFSLIFQFHKSDTFRILLPVMLTVAVYSAVVAYFEIEVLDFGHRSTGAMHTLLGFVISLLLAFRTNSAYDRWWEGRRAWGSLVNSSRNLALKLNAMTGTDHAARARLADLLAAYADGLKDHLRMKKPALAQPHRPNIIAADLMSECNALYRSGVISGEQLLMLNTDLSMFTDICGICERIKRTPIPYSYSLFIKKFIFAYILTMPFSFLKEFGYAIVPATTFVFYVLASLELIAEEIEDPFGTDANDLPLDDLAAAIRKNVHDILIRPLPDPRL